MNYCAGNLNLVETVKKEENKFSNFIVERTPKPFLEKFILHYIYLDIYNAIFVFKIINTFNKIKQM